MLSSEALLFILLQDLNIHVEALGGRATENHDLLLVDSGWALQVEVDEILILDRNWKPSSLRKGKLVQATEVNVLNHSVMRLLSGRGDEALEDKNVSIGDTCHWGIGPRLIQRRQSHPLIGLDIVNLCRFCVFFGLDLCVTSCNQNEPVL